MAHYIVLEKDWFLFVLCCPSGLSSSLTPQLQKLNMTQLYVTMDDVLRKNELNFDQVAVSSLHFAVV